MAARRQHVHHPGMLTRWVFMSRLLIAIGLLSAMNTDLIYANRHYGPEIHGQPGRLLAAPSFYRKPRMPAAAQDPSAAHLSHQVAGFA
jgi:hypothetical protein